MSYTRFNLHIEKGIAQLSFNRPDKANSLDKASWDEMPQVFEDLSQRLEVRVIVLSGAGKHFCAGIDLQMLASLTPTHIKDEGRKREELRRIVFWMQKGINAIEVCSKPVIAAINGACIGAGLDLIAACDMRYASQEAYFSLKEVDLGMVADLGSLQRLPRLIPEGVVREMAYTGEKYSAELMRQFGLVNRVYGDSATLQSQVLSIAESISKKSPLAVRGIKRVALHARDSNVEQGLDYVATWNAAHLLGNDLMKAIQAQMTKQEADFED